MVIRPSGAVSGEAYRRCGHESARPVRTLGFKMADCCQGNGLSCRLVNAMDFSERTAWLSLGKRGAGGAQGRLAVLSGSLAIKADAIHSLSDVLSSLVILAGIRISRRASRQFPFGLYKVENLVALGGLPADFLRRLRDRPEGLYRSLPNSPRPHSLASAGIGLTIVITWLFSRMS